MCTHAIKKKKTVVLNTSCRSRNDSISGVHQVRPSSGRFTSSQILRGSILVGGSNKGSSRAAKKAVQVQALDSNDKYVTPLTLHHAESNVMQPKPDSFFLDDLVSSLEIEHLKSNSSFSSVRSGSQLSGLSISKESEDSFSSPREVPWKKEKVIQPVTEEMLDDSVEIALTETDTFTLLDIPSTIVSEDDDNAGAIQERNMKYAELCKNRLGNDKYVPRSSQTIYGEKPKSIQTDKIVMKEKGTVATGWDIYDSFCEQTETSKGENGDCPESSANTSKGQEKRGETNSDSSDSSSIDSTSSSLSGMDMYGNGSNTELDPKVIMSSKSFQHSLLVMERTIVRNIFQPKLAAYRQLPILEAPQAQKKTDISTGDIPSTLQLTPKKKQLSTTDPDGAVKPGTRKQDEADEESSPNLERLWTFSCEFTRGHTVTSMAWNKKDPDILAVGYSDCDPSNPNPGLICCWTIRNLTWPERVIRCHSFVTSLDFSVNNPGQLAVGMYDGTVAIYNVQRKTCIANSSDCPKKHLQPVWQVTWTQQEVKLSGEDREEALISVSADSRVTKWVLGSNGLASLDLITLKRTKKKSKNVQGGKERAECFLATLTPGYCVDFHPTDFSTYLASTGDGLIHKCSIYQTKQALDSYKQHTCPVNHVEWSPFSSDVFLSCSSDWTIQLWRQDQLKPVLSFTFTQEPVFAVRWSPNLPTIFAAMRERQVEIWDLKSLSMLPTIVHHAVPDVKMTSLLFSRGTDCILVGDSDGQVTVYKLNNFSAGEGKEGNSLDDIIQSAVSRTSFSFLQQSSCCFSRLGACRLPSTAQREVNLDLKVTRGTVSV